MGVFRPLQFNKAICFVIKVRCTWSALSLSVSICVNKSTCSVQFHTDIIPFWGNLYPHVLLTCGTHNAFPCTFLKTETWPIPLKQTSHSCFRCCCFMRVLGHLSISLLFAETSHITCRLRITYKPLNYSIKRIHLSHTLIPFLVGLAFFSELISTFRSSVLVDLCDVQCETRLGSLPAH